jgi:hypothetical protein
VANEGALGPEERRGRGLDEAAIDVPVSERWDVRPAPEEARRAAAPAQGRRHDGRGRTDGAEQAKGGEESPDEAARKKRRRWLIIGALALLALIRAAWYGVHWYTVGRYLVSTDDAYTEADNVALRRSSAATRTSWPTWTASGSWVGCCSPASSPSSSCRSRGQAPHRARIDG